MTLGPTPIVLPTITTADLLLAATLLVLPQVPLTLANSCLAPADAAPSYFPDAAPRITPSRLARTLGVANLGVGAISGMPLCHGAGGMSAHHAFGARTWRAPALIGGALTALALLLGQDLALVLRAFPVAILAALLLVAGITHVRLLADVRGRFDWAAAAGHRRRRSHRPPAGGGDPRARGCGHPLHAAPRHANAAQPDAHAICSRRGSAQPAATPPGTPRAGPPDLRCAAPPRGRPGRRTRRGTR